MADFLNMGGYAFFIWPSYILTIVVLVVLGGLAYRFLHAQEKILEELEKDQPSGKADQ